MYTIEEIQKMLNSGQFILLTSYHYNKLVDTVKWQEEEIERLQKINRRKKK